MATSIPLALSLALSHSPRSLAHAQLQQLVGYPGPSPKKPQCDKETRGKTFAFTKTVEDAQGKKTKLVAAIHNCKQPMMLISTASTLIPTHPRVKAWRKTLPDGSHQVFTRTTDQTEVCEAAKATPRSCLNRADHKSLWQMHEFYHHWFHQIDDHNELRQGEVSFADAWETNDWAERHFAEGLGFWEVNVFKAAVTFQGVTYNHNEFRKRLAHAFLTLGKVPYEKSIDEIVRDAKKTKVCLHHMRSFEAMGAGRAAKLACGYCGARSAYLMCVDCFPTYEDVKYGICNPVTGRTCVQEHVLGTKEPKTTKQPMKPAKAMKRARGLREGVTPEEKAYRANMRELASAGGLTTQANKRKKRREQERA